MPRLRIFFDVEGWAYHWRALALKQYAPADYEVTISPWCDHDGDEPDLGDVQPDVIFCLPSTRLVRLRAALERSDWNSAVVGSWATGWPHLISRFHEAYELSDLLIVNHYDAWARTGRLPATVVVNNGVDHSVFSVTNEMVSRSPKVLWTGSPFHAAVKGYHSHVLPLMKALRKAGVQSEALYVDSFGDSKRTPAEMADWYNEGTVLVCASALEGAPNPCLEAAACGCTLVSTPVGSMPDLIRDGVNGYLVDRTVDALFEGVQKALSNYESLATQMQEDIRPWFYRARAAEFYAAFDRALDRSANRSSVRVRPDRPDLRKELTVFVSTVGAPSYSACLRLLDLQDCRFDVQIIENVAPMRKI